LWIEILDTPMVQRAHNDALKKSKVTAFPQYTFRHSALTDLAVLGCDAFTLARIAGHSSISITQRYCHPQADAIESVCAGSKPKTGHQIGHP
jgi:site-specific recombinase XerD